MKLLLKKLIPIKKCYMFRNNCFDMAININDRDIILSNERTKKILPNLF